MGSPALAGRTSQGWDARAAAQGSRAVPQGVGGDPVPRRSKAARPTATTEQAPVTNTPDIQTQGA